MKAIIVQRRESRYAQRRQNAIGQLLETIETLTEEERDAVAFVMANYDVLAEICKVKKLTTEKRLEMIKNERRRGDAVRLVMVIFERVVNGE